MDANAIALMHNPHPHFDSQGLVMWRRIFKLQAAPRPVPSPIVAALVDVNLLSLHLAEARALLANHSDSVPALRSIMEEFTASAASLLAELPGAGAEVDEWRAVQRRSRLLTASFEGARLGWSNLMINTAS